MAYIVLGASRGLGRSVAERLAARDGTIILSGRSIEALKETEQRIAQASRTATTKILTVDLVDEKSIDEFVQRLSELQEPIRAFVNTSAGFYKGSFVDQSLQSIDELLNTSYVGVVRLISRLIKNVPYSKPFDVINVTSVSAATNLDAGRSSSLHIATKAALQTFSVVLGRELSNAGVRMCAMAPGTFARHGRAGIPEDVISDCVDFIIDLPASACVESLVIRPTAV
ncbi:MAG TPA: SDR family NAD(P)-dependent oxidoreductase [Pyrinomonadaceae bacterium]|jgi:short-subunit dehydrogenase|nr:SDR family NAD(P)-dependent oxidoreductase [Pyrinomonadaceae bacterium]